MRKMDHIDVKILSILQADGKTTNVSLAKQVHLSTTPCLERVKALENEGFITGYSAKLSPAHLGLGLVVFIWVLLDRTTEDAFEKFKEAVLQIKEIQECHMVTGGFDYFLKVRVTDMTAYRNFLGHVLSHISGIKQTHSYPVMEEIKESSQLTLDHLLP